MTTPELYPYQIEGARWLRSRRHALLADEMGVGKTVQAIVAAPAGPVLVICPAVARAMWQGEWSRWAPFHKEVEIVSYDEARIRRQELAGSRWSLLILDEAHFLKSSEAARTKAILGRGGLIHSSDRMWALTGTPMPNGDPSELWPLLFSCGVTKLARSVYLSRYCTGYETRWGWKSTGCRKEMAGELSAMISSFMLRRLKRDVIKSLPPFRVDHLLVAEGEVDLDRYFPKMAQQIAQEKAKLESELKDPDVDLQSIAGHVTTLRRLVGHMKVGAVVEILRDELETGALQKVVVFCVHREIIDLTHKGLERFGVVEIHGGTPDRLRQFAVTQFQTDPAIRVFVGQVTAAGTALTLTAASEMVQIELDWTPSTNEQSWARCHRIGQSQPVRVRVAILAGSIDVDVSRVLMRKQSTIDQIVDRKGTTI